MTFVKVEEPFGNVSIDSFATLKTAADGETRIFPEPGVEFLQYAAVLQLLFRAVEDFAKLAADSEHNVGCFVETVQFIFQVSAQKYAHQVLSF